MHFFLSVCHRWRGWGLRSIRGMKPPYIFIHSRSFPFSTKEWKSSSTKKSYGMLYSKESTKAITWTRYPIIVRRKSSIFLLIDWLGNFIDSLFCKHACVSIHFQGGFGGYSPLLWHLPSPFGGFQAAESADAHSAGLLGCFKPWMLIVCIWAETR